MKITPSERETLLGPAVVGMILGVSVAICTVAFDSEYGEATLLWQRVLNAFLSLLGGFLLAFVPFGLAPMLIARLTQGNRNG